MDHTNNTDQATALLDEIRLAPSDQQITNRFKNHAGHAACGTNCGAGCGGGCGAAR
jgi:hypothetical protein